MKAACIFCHAGRQECVTLTVLVRKDSNSDGRTVIHFNLLLINGEGRLSSRVFLSALMGLTDVYIKTIKVYQRQHFFMKTGYRCRREEL